MLVVVFPAPPFCVAIETILRRFNILKAAQRVFQYILKLCLVWQKGKASVKRQFQQVISSTPKRTLSAEGLVIYLQWRTRLKSICTRLRRHLKACSTSLVAGWEGCLL